MRPAIRMEIERSIYRMLKWEYIVIESHTHSSISHPALTENEAIQQPGVKRAMQKTDGVNRQGSVRESNTSGPRGSNGHIPIILGAGMETRTHPSNHNDALDRRLKP